MGYFGYYVAWVLLSYAIRQPWLLAGVVVLWLLRGFIPRPGALFGALGRAGRLRQQVAVNRANVTARRDLATIYLDLLRPRRALGLLEEGLALAPDDPELLYLSGLALHRAGQHEQALERLLRAVDKDHRLRHGEPYLVAADALLALRRWEDAIDGYERFIDFNSSHVGVHTQLAKAHAGARKRDAARKALRDGIATWHNLPGSMKRRQFGAYLRAQWARITVLKDAVAIVVVVFGAVLLGNLGYVLYPVLLEAFRRDDFEDRMLRAAQNLGRSRPLCGTQQTGDFQGKYEVTAELPPDYRLEDLRSAPGELGEEDAQWLEEQKRRFSNFEIAIDRIKFGEASRGEFCLTKVTERTPELLRAEAIALFEGDEYDSMVLFSLRRGQGQTVTLSYNYEMFGPEATSTLTLRRKP